MVSVLYEKKHLRINQIWYLREKTISNLLEEKRKADILFVHGVSKDETNGQHRGNQIFHTSMLDLTISEEDLLKNVGKNVRYEIRRSEKEDVQVVFYTAKQVLEDDTLLQKFQDIYERMYASKGMQTKFNVDIVREYLKENAIVFSTVWYQNEMMIFHSYIYDDIEVRFLHSASFFREQDVDQNLIGRANKRLQWEDIKYFQKLGLQKYDFGGISSFEQPNGIDDFKLKFGGDHTTYYNVFVGNTLKGKLAVWGMKLLHKAD